MAILTCRDRKSNNNNWVTVHFLIEIPPKIKTENVTEHTYVEQYKKKRRRKSR
ncbi:hypothetical protein Phum_PHUM598040 [Pediculus humanus corporis]|uniref:Uncharacterized protein n=1 Tax=Pediculus humanus subsp. corporis TaxID=121224 RepID=E0W2W2_PEDHC|nr:uncharacterized protein Phum_PHUM598040 [Pediculus humanus corporis]EEB19968.1 hypothetical protein Phum_PHUM598040 [Pediculus humanus corporis]